MATNRETERDALVVLLAAALVGGGLPCKQVTGHKVASLEEVTPLVTVLSVGTDRVIDTFQGGRVTFAYSVQAWVLQSYTGWSYADAMDALDEIEVLIAETYRAGTTNKKLLTLSGKTRVFEVVEASSSIPYYMEEFPTEVRLANG